MPENDPGSQVVRRHLGTAPDTTLLLSGDPMASINAFNQWVSETGMDPRQVLGNTVCAAPLPEYLDSPVGPRQFSEVNPATLWHPLFWLPSRLAAPYTLTITDPQTGEPIMEPVESWVLRVALEMTVSGLYDPAEGWVDLLEAAGIDTTTPEGVERVAAWQAGAPDPVLDRLDLDAYLFNAEDPDWADELAAQMLPAITDAHWALIADDLLGRLDQASTTQDFEKSRQLVALACNLAASSLIEAPTPQGAPPMGELFDAVRAAAFSWNSDRASFESGPVRTATDWLSLLRNQLWPAVEAFEPQPQEA